MAYKMVAVQTTDTAKITVIDLPDEMVSVADNWINLRAAQKALSEYMIAAHSRNEEDKEMLDVYKMMGKRVEAAEIELQSLPLFAEVYDDWGFRKMVWEVQHVPPITKEQIVTVDDALQYLFG